MNIIEKSISQIKALSAEVVSNAKSGHTGTALGASTLMFTLFHDFLVFNPKDTEFLNRDRVVFSAGHASALYYSLLHAFGYDLGMEDLKAFRTYGSRTPGHPEFPVVPGVEITTGPLGQGVANSVGLAIGQEMMAARFNTEDIKLFDNYTYCLAGDGCLMEGVAMEACSLAGTLGLSKFVLLYDDNEITIDGARSIASSEDVEKKFKAMNFETIVVGKGNDYMSCYQAIERAKLSTKPTIIIFKTKIGIDTKYEGTSAVHAMPLSSEDMEAYKKKMGVSESFHLSGDVLNFCKKTIDANLKIYEAWQKKLAQYQTKYPEKYAEFCEFLAPKLPDFGKILKDVSSLDGLEGRNVSHIILNKIAEACPSLVGGNADLKASTKAFIDKGGDFSPANRLGRNVCFGVREHAMGSVCNGIARYSKFLVFDSTFFAFSNYMMPSLKMRGMMNLPVISIFSHDSLLVGQDGPTHQPIEQFAQVRALIGVNVFRPATYSEVIAGWKYFLKTKQPTILLCSKSKLICDEVLPDDAMRGGYIYKDTAGNPNIQIIATGTELKLALDVAESLAGNKVRVISMPSEKLFASQPDKYKNSVLLEKPKLTVVIEASNDTVWYKYLSKNDLLVNVTEYQCSASGEEVYEKAGFNKTSIISKIIAVLNKK